MEAVLDRPQHQLAVREAAGSRRDDLAQVVAAMGRRLQRVYLEGAIPYLRQHEPALWEELRLLEEEDSFGAVAAYERLFLAGLLRYAAALAPR